MRYPANFVFPTGEGWPEIYDLPVGSLSEDDFRDSCQSGRRAWTLGTYVHLARAGYDVRISPGFDRSAINICHHEHLRLAHAFTRAFILCCRADRCRPHLANFWINQNTLEAPGPRSDNLHLWPQPGLVPRDSRRGARLENLVFKGHPRNLDAAFRSDRFREDLAGLGVTLTVAESRDGTGLGAWADYGEVDLVLAVRNLTRVDAAAKPPSKLSNAWAAGVPALLGPEPAFRSLRRSEHDYIEVASPGDVLAAIRRMKAEPGLYGRMVANGHRRAEAFTVPSLVDQWVACLDGPVARAFEQWRRAPGATRTLPALIGAARLFAARQSWPYLVHFGPRILS